MTEAEWLATEFWPPMLDHVRDRAGIRKMLLLATALCRRIWHHFPFDDCRQLVEAVERLADHSRVDSEDYSVADEVDALGDDLHTKYGRVREADDGSLGAYLTAMECGGMWHDPDGKIELVAVAVAITIAGNDQGLEWEAERKLQAKLLHELFGNPFRPVAFDSRWRSETVVSLASAIYAERAFNRLPILADALEEAGCDRADVLSHCRGSGPHVRGCWVVDLVLGKG